MLLDFAIIGDSIAGAAAARSLSQENLRGAWLADCRDGGGVDSRIWDEPNGRAPNRRNGIALRRVATQVRPAGERIRIQTLEGSRLEVAHVVAAPFGTEEEAPERLGFARFRGRGVSTDAATDAPFFPRVPVAVLGCGYRAAEQALIAARSAERVVVLCPAEPDFQDLVEPVEECSRVEVRRCDAVEELLGGEEGEFAGAMIRTSSGLERVVASALFLGQGLLFDAGTYGGLAVFRAACDQGAVIPAGKGAGVPHPEADLQWDSGLGAASELLQKLAREP